MSSPCRSAGGDASRSPSVLTSLDFSPDHATPDRCSSESSEDDTAPRGMGTHGGMGKRRSTLRLSSHSTKRVAMPEEAARQPRTPLKFTLLRKAPSGWASPPATRRPAAPLAPCPTQPPASVVSRVLQRQTGVCGPVVGYARVPPRLMVPMHALLRGAPQAMACIFLGFTKDGRHMRTFVPCARACLGGAWERHHACPVVSSCVGVCACVARAAVSYTNEEYRAVRLQVWRFALGARLVKLAEVTLFRHADLRAALGQRVLFDGESALSLSLTHTHVHAHRHAYARRTRKRNLSHAFSLRVGTDEHFRLTFWQSEDDRILGVPTPFCARVVPVRQCVCACVRVLQW